MKSKEISLKKIILISVLTFISMLPLTVKLILNTSIDNNQKNFFSQFVFYYSNDFSIENLLISFFIFCFYFNVYFNNEKYTVKNFALSIIAILISLVILYSQITKNTCTEFLYNSNYIVNCILFFIGIYFIVYAVLKKYILPLKIKKYNKYIS